MTDAPKRIAFRKKYMSDATTNGPLMDDPNYIHYIRADLSADLVRAGYLVGLEAAADSVPEGFDGMSAQVCAALDKCESVVRALAADPEALAAIVVRVTEGK